MQLLNRVLLLTNIFLTLTLRLSSATESSTSTSTTRRCRNTSRWFATTKPKTWETACWRSTGSRSTSWSATVRTPPSDLRTSWNCRRKSGSGSTWSAEITWFDCRTTTSSSCASASTTTTSTNEYRSRTDFWWWGKNVWLLSLRNSGCVSSLIVLNKVLVEVF